MNAFFTDVRCQPLTLPNSDTTNRTTLVLKSIGVRCDVGYEAEDIKRPDFTVKCLETKRWKNVYNCSRK